MSRFVLFLCLPIFTLLSACNTTFPLASEDRRLNSYFEQSFAEEVSLYPQWQTELGQYDNHDQWNDISDETHELRVDLARRRLAALANYDYDALSDATQISYKIFEYRAKQTIEQSAWRDRSYAVSQFSGVHTEIPSFLINDHKIGSLKQAQDYIARLKTSGARMDQSLAQIRTRADKGFLPPAFTFAQMIGSARNVIKGAPFDKSDKDTPILADFKGKINGLNLEDSQKAELVAEAEDALLTVVKPAYERFINTIETLSKTTSANHGVWALDPSGRYYQALLKRHTTTDLSADEIHNIGLGEVKRIHAEMNAIKQTVGFKGSLNDFFAFLKTDDQFYYPNTDEGRAQYLADAEAYIKAMEARLDEVFFTTPKAPLVVKRVEAFRERAAGKAFYMSPSPDGDRPGVYYANLMDMRQMPNYQMEALAYHEGVPGHHMQIAISNELKDLPQFRRFTGTTAYIEGWGLYTEYLPKEMGFYEDPYSDFGRLAMELWRACRLVVDTGLHAKRWSKERATQYLRDNTPNPEDDVVKAIERYLVYPGQATAYKIGMLKIQELRTRAEQALGDKFDIRAFHDVILRNGAVPLSLMEELVDAYIVKAKGAAKS